jgi:hypothetical protein
MGKDVKRRERNKEDGERETEERGELKYVMENRRGKGRGRGGLRNSMRVLPYLPRECVLKKIRIQIELICRSPPYVKRLFPIYLGSRAAHEANLVIIEYIVSADSLQLSPVYSAPRWSAQQSRSNFDQAPSYFLWPFVKVPLLCCAACTGTPPPPHPVLYGPVLDPSGVDMTDMTDYTCPAGTSRTWGFQIREQISRTSGLF